MKKNDVILLAMVILLAAGAFLWFQLGTNKPAETAVVYVDGEESAAYSLMEDGEYRIDTQWGENILVIKGGKADVTEADCPDELCVKQKAIHKNGETIVCLPHKVVVEIQGGESSDLDAITR